MGKTLIIDPAIHSTFLTKIFEEFDYWAPGGSQCLNSLDESGLLKTYNINGIYDVKKLETSYDNVFLCYEIEGANRYGYSQGNFKAQDGIIKDKQTHLNYIYDVLS